MSPLAASRVKTIRMVFSNCSASWALPTVSGVVQGRTRINVKLTEKDGEVTDFNFSGFEVTPADWERFVTDSLSWLGQFDMVCVSGSLPSGVSPEAFTDWMTRLRSQCPCIIFDSSREALVAGLKAAPWLVKP